MVGQHSRRASEGSLRNMERRAEIAFQRDRDREGGGLSQQVAFQLAYWRRLPSLWRRLYVLMFFTMLVGFMMKATGVGVLNVLSDSEGLPASLAGLNLTEAEPQELPAVSVNASEFVVRAGAKLMLDGRPFYFAGFCNYYMLTRAADKTGSGRKEAIQTLQKAQELGMTVLRMWAFNDGADQWHALQPALGLLDEAVLTDGLDWLVAEAPQYGIRLLLSLTNGDTGFGGMEQYVKWAKGTSVTDFYTNPKIRAAFKSYVGAIITRRNTVTGVHYRDDPSILGWELANEPSNPGDDTGEILQEWIDDLAAHVKELDSNHLVTVGLIGWYGASTPDRLTFNPPSENVNNPMAEWHHNFDAACLGSDYVRHQAGPNIDVMMVHMYPDSWLSCPEDCKRDWAIRWMRAHFEDAAAAGKPVVVGEFGKVHHGGMHRRRDFLEMVYAEVEDWNAKRGGNVAGTLLWMVATDSYADYDGFTIYTTRRAAAEVQPKTELTIEMLLEHQIRKQFLNWEGAMKCMERRALPATPAPGALPPAVEGWNRTLELIRGAALASADANADAAVIVPEVGAVRGAGLDSTHATAGATVIVPEGGAVKSAVGAAALEAAPAPAPAVSVAATAAG